MTRRPLKPLVVVLVGIGGAAGAAARYGIGWLFPTGTGAFPWTTLGINLAGSVLLALLAALAVVRRHEHLPALLGTGMLGGFTTLSTFTEEARTLVAEGAAGSATLYVVGSVAACLVGVALADLSTSRVAREEFEGEEGDL